MNTKADTAITGAEFIEAAHAIYNRLQPRKRGQKPELAGALLLAKLAEDGPMTPTEISEWLGCTTAAVTFLVRSAADRSFVERVPVDYRSYKAAITAPGRRRLAEILA